MNESEAKICRTLSSLETDFLRALQQGSEAINTFQNSWIDFSALVEEDLEKLQEDTKSNIYTFIATVSIITSHLLEVDVVGNGIQSQLHEYVTQLLREEFSHLSIHDKNTSADEPVNGAYIPLAYQWLLENLHNPYPPKETRYKIANIAKCKVKDIDAWFVDSRKRIGWNQLRKRFAKRADLIQAATQFFKPSESTTGTFDSLKSTLGDNSYHEHANAFVQMEEYARELYSNKLFASDLASDLSTQSHNNAHDYKRNGRLVGNTLRSPYPSPEPSPSPRSTSKSLSPSLSGHTTRKRKRSVSPSLGQPSKGVKCARTNIQNDDEALAAQSLPSPAASIQSYPEKEDALLIPSSNYGSSQSSTKRKRALSDVGVHVIKRPNNALSSKRLHSASNPMLPSGHYTEEIFAMNPACVSDIEITNAIPPPVSEVSVDEHVEYDVSYYQDDWAGLMSSQVNRTYSLGDSLTHSNFPEQLEDIPIQQVNIIAEEKTQNGDPCNITISTGKPLGFSDEMLLMLGLDDISDPIVNEFWPSALLNQEAMPSGYVNDYHFLDVNNLSSLLGGQADCSSTAVWPFDLTSATSHIYNHQPEFGEVY